MTDPLGSAWYDSAGNEITRHGPSKFLGEVNLLSGQAAFVTAAAQTPLRYIAVDREALRSLLFDDGPLSSIVLATFIGVKLFRWEKEEKIPGTAKLWLLAVLAPFLILGVYQAYSKDSVVKARLLNRDLQRSRSLLIRDARIVIGAPGGTFISLAIAQGIVNVIDFGMSMLEAVAAPRFTATGHLTSRAR